jgi:predicted transposase YbfD/YdcC
VQATSAIGWLQDLHPQWVELKSIVAVTAKREGQDKTTEETRYFISSMDASDPKRLGQVVRAHWGIEKCCTGCWTMPLMRIPSVQG